MRKIAILAAAVSAVIAVPAAANEGHAEVRGGIAWANGVEEAVAGVAAGYDWDLGDTVFVGVEGSADKVLASGTEVVFGATGRLGAKLSENTKIFAASGVSFSDGDENFHLGGGIQHALSESLYVKAEYRHFFDDFIDVNTAVVGVGLRF